MKALTAPTVALLATVTLAFTCTATFSPAEATGISEPQTTQEKILELSPGLSSEELDQALGDYATQENITIEQAAQDTLDDLQGSLTWAQQTEQPKARGAGINSGAVVVRDRPLTSGVNKGDLFVTAATTLNHDHGHTGIYFEPNRIIEAPGLGKR